MRPRSRLAMLTVLMCGCGAAAPGVSSASSGAATKGPTAALGTIEGTVTLTHDSCGGARVPPPGSSCTATDPFATTFAVADQPAAGQLRLVSLVSSDAAGRFQVRVPAGHYLLVPKAAVAADSYDYSWAPIPVDVAAGQTVERDIAVLAPQPPISIGVGN